MRPAVRSDPHRESAPSSADDGAPWRIEACLRGNSRDRGTRRRSGCAAGDRCRPACRSARRCRPASRTIRSDSDSASSWSWVTMIVVMPRLRCSALISERTSSRSLRSSAASGSSSRQDVGLEDDRPGQRHPLLLSAGKLVRPPRLEARSAEPGAAHPRHARPLRAKGRAGRAAERRYCRRSTYAGTAHSSGRRARCCAGPPAHW